MLFEGRFYSRRNGWEGGLPAKCFHSSPFHTSFVNILEDKSGKDIYKLAYIEPDIAEYARVHSDWYFYYGPVKMITLNSLD